MSEAASSLFVEFHNEKDTPKWVRWSESLDGLQKPTKTKKADRDAAGWLIEKSVEEEPNQFRDLGRLFVAQIVELQDIAPFFVSALQRMRHLHIQESMREFSAANGKTCQQTKTRDI